MINSGAIKDCCIKMGQIGNNESPSSYLDAYLPNRIDEISTIFDSYPKYMDCFRKCHTFLLRGDGPLPYYCRHYIAMMASACHRCRYLVSAQKKEYLCVGGEEAWLKGIEVMPQRLKQLSEINMLLAHSPWSLNGTHIEALMRGKKKWSLSELIHAIVLLCHFHALSGLVWGCGLNGKTRNNKHITEERRARVFAYNSTSSSEDLSQPCEDSDSRKQKSDDLLCFVEDYAFDNLDTCTRVKSPEVLNLRVQDCSWEIHGFSLLNRLYGDAGNYLDDRFRQCSITNKESKSWTVAVWNYVQCIFGIKSDDFDYNQVNSILDLPLRSYIKAVCHHPERIYDSGVDSVTYSKYSEQVHLNAIILEARLQSELLYAVRAVLQYMVCS